MSNPDGSFSVQVVGNDAQARADRPLAQHEIEYLQASSSRIRRFFTSFESESKLSSKEKAVLREYREAQAVIRSMNHNLWLQLALLKAYMDIPGMVLIVFAMNSKGYAGKSTTLLYVLSIIKRHTGTDVVLYPTTINADASSAGVVAGIQTNELTLTQSKFTEARTRGLFRRPSDMFGLLAQTHHNVHIVPEDRVLPNTPARPSYEVGEYREDVEELAKVFNVIALDGNNDSYRRDNVLAAAADIATVILYVGNSELPQTMERVKAGISLGESTITVGHSVGDDRLIDGRHVSLREKTDNAVVTVTNVPIGLEVDFDGLREGTQHTGPTQVIQQDPYMKTNIVVDLDRINLMTYLQYVTLAVQLLEQSAETLGLSEQVAAARAYVESLPVPTEGDDPQVRRMDDLGRTIPRPEFFIPKLPDPSVYGVSSTRAGTVVELAPAAVQAPPPGYVLPEQHFSPPPGALQHLPQQPTPPPPRMVARPPVPQPPWLQEFNAARHADPQRDQRIDFPVSGNSAR